MTLRCGGTICSNADHGLDHEPEMNRVESVFEVADEDGGGYLDKEEFRLFFLIIAQGPVTRPYTAVHYKDTLHISYSVL